MSDLTRESKIEYLREDGGDGNIRRRVVSMLNQHGPDWLTDKQIDEIFQAEVGFQEMRERLNAENRKARGEA